MSNINDIEIFWNLNPGGINSSYKTVDKESFFKKNEDERYSRYPEILSYADFKSCRGKKILEVGCGIGADGILFARHGAYYTGVDLTETAVEISRERFRLLGLKGQILKLNAEKLSFPDNYFDLVYSFGVIHHTHCPDKIVSEIYRVLKPGGNITIMLYNRTSFYYLLEVKVIRKIFFKICNRKNLCGALFSLYNKRLFSRFEFFREKLEKMKMLNSYPSENEWIAMNTDNVFCPMARVYSKKEANKLFSLFSDFKTEVWFIDKDNWIIWLVFGRFIPNWLEKWLESKLGWFRMVKARKPA